MSFVKKSLPAAHRLLVAAHGQIALITRSCLEWFYKFKNGEFVPKTKSKCTFIRSN